MRYGILALGVAVCIGLYAVWSADGSGAALSDDARLAIDLRCQGREGRSVTDCRRLLVKLYRAGRLDPERTLRVHCTPLETVAWGSRPRPPALCVERYGGWLRS